MSQRLHLLAIPHTVTRSDFSHCAFTGKVQRFSPMMRKRGYEVLHYGTDQATSGADQDLIVMTVEEQEELLGHKHHSDPTGFAGRDANASSPLYKQWNYNTRALLEEHVQPGDIICAPFGPAHQPAVAGLPLLSEADRTRSAWLVETGIGYPETFAPYRIYESEAWRHVHAGHPKRGQMGSDWEWVIPNYFDTSEWPLGKGEGGFLLYFGRLIDTKGMMMVCEVARHRPDLRVVLCGQGEPGYYTAQSPNIEYLPPKSGAERAALVGAALAVILPTRYVEPFGGVAVEAMLCGTPVLTSDFGAFTETVQEGDGFRCRTLGDYLAALELIEEEAADDEGARELRRDSAVRRFSLDAVGRKYSRAFDTISELAGDGIMTLHSAIGPVLKAVDPGPSIAQQALTDPVMEWKLAQKWERTWWMTHPHIWSIEQKKQETYAALMEIPRLAEEVPERPGALFDLRHQRVLDMGCGPFSLLLRTWAHTAVAVDPLDFGPDLEAAYQHQGIQRVFGAGEDLVTAEEFDEGWMYNCLQHVRDPALVLANLAKHCRRVRFFEWLQTPKSDGHLHVLREELFSAAFPEERWTRVKWAPGFFDTPALVGNYLAAVVERKQ
jgi:SAM-dependent methyltransferase